MFGTAAIESATYDIMAAVMVGGMVSPLGSSRIATMLFKKPFHQQRAAVRPDQYRHGLAFITEGAIPFAAGRPVARHPLVRPSPRRWAACPSMAFWLHADGSARRRVRSSRWSATR